jgi:hypothetical protein
MLRHLISASYLPVLRFHSYQRRIFATEGKSRASDTTNATAALTYAVASSSYTNFYRLSGSDVFVIACLYFILSDTLSGMHVDGTGISTSGWYMTRKGPFSVMYVAPVSVSNRI